MKKKTLILVSLAVCFTLESNTVASQGIGTPVYDAKQDFWKQMDKIETKAYKAKDWLYSLEQIKFLRAQFMRMDTLRRATQGAYDLSNKIYENTKKVAALKDFGIDDAAFMAEKVIGMPVDPSFYMIRAKGEKYNKFVKAIGYNPGKDIDANAKEIYSFLLQYDSNSGAGEGGNRIDLFDQISRDYMFEDDWRKMVKMEDAKAMAKLRASIVEELEKRKKQIKLLQIDNKYSMTLAERMATIERLRKESENLNDSLRKQNKIIGVYIAEKNRRNAMMMVANVYSDNWGNFIRKMRRAKVIGECHLRDVDKSRRPITKIVYDWK